MLPALALLAGTLAAPPPEAAQLRRAAEFFHAKVARRGGYAFYQSLDGPERWGEGKAGPDTIFVQPPGTPTVGMAYLSAYRATGDRFHLDAARDAAEALARGRLPSGGWGQSVTFGARPARDFSTLDDGATQAALRFLLAADAALGGRNAPVSAAAKGGFGALLAAQFPGGGFPQGWSGPSPALPVLAASYPDYDWKTEGRVKNYWELPTLNDGLAGTVAATLLAGHAAGDARALPALRKLGDFLILAQMPEPQPAWCQQYTREMRPAWARKFEPPAVTGWESQDAMEALIGIARATGEKKYLEPIPKAVAYLRKSLLPDGRVARFYELRTNKPLYMDAAYRLTYDDGAAPEHYGWKQSSRLDAIEKAYRAALANEPVAERKPSEADARRALAELDAEGRWVSVYAGERLVGQPKFAAGFRYLSSAVFARNVEAVSAWLGGK